MPSPLPAGVIYYEYLPNQVVWVIHTSECADPNASSVSVEEGTVLRVRAEALVTETTVEYDIRRTGQTGTDEYAEEDVFATKADALVEYGSRIS